MSWAWLATFAAGFIAGGVVAGVALRLHQLDRDTAKYDAGVRDAHDGIAPLRPVADLPRERASVHPVLLGALTALGFLALGYTVGGW